MKKYVCYIFLQKQFKLLRKLQKINVTKQHRPLFSPEEYLWPKYICNNILILLIIYWLIRNICVEFVIGMEDCILLMLTVFFILPYDIYYSIEIYFNTDRCSLKFVGFLWYFAIMYRHILFSSSGILFILKMEQ